MNRKSPSINRIMISLGAILVIWVALFCMNTDNAFATGELTVEQLPVAWSPAGGYTDISFRVTNNTSEAVTGISVIDQTLLTDEDGYEWTPYEFQYYRNSKDKCHDPTGATEDDLGYTINAHGTATFYIRVFNRSSRGIGTYSEDFIKLGKRHREIIYDYDPVTDMTTVQVLWVVDSEYTDNIPVTNKVYDPSNAALSIGTSVNYGSTINEFGSTIDFGTIDLSGNSQLLKTNRGFYAKNVTTGAEPHGNSQAIKVEFSLEGPDGDVLDAYCVGFDDDLIGGSSWSPLEPASGGQFNFATGTLSVDATGFIAGTYTASLIIETSPYAVKINGDSTNTAGRHVIPVKVKLTGTNPRLPKRATGLTANPGNNQVELTWASKDQDVTYYVYRCEGKETKTNPDSWTLSDWNRYEQINGAAVTARSDGSYIFVDGTADNDKTYSYVVSADGPFRAYASTPVQATPKSTYTSRIQAPAEVFAKEHIDGVLLEWEMNESYGGISYNGESLVNHFNIYRDGVLVKQVHQNSFIDEVQYGSVSEPDGSYHYGVTGHEYSWETFVETPQLNQPYVFTVAAVSKAGVEGYLSEEAVSCGIPEAIEIISHTASYYVWGGDDGETPEIYLKVYSSPDTLESMDIWRNEGTEAPDTSQPPFRTVLDYAEYYDSYDIKPNSIYTYTVQLTDIYGNKSSLYTFPVAAKDNITSGMTDVDWNVVDYGRKVRMIWYCDSYYNDATGENVYTGTYKVYRNDALVGTYTSSNPIVDDEGSRYFKFEQDPGEDGTYTYRIDKITGDITVRGRDYVFVRNMSEIDESQFVQLPDAPSLNVRISGEKPVLEWVPAPTGGKPDGYHIYRKDAGAFVCGNRYKQDAPWLSRYWQDWGNNRYLTIQDASTRFFVDTVYPVSGESFWYLGDDTLGSLVSVGWDEEECPHEYWITAYNEAGESAPSQVFTFEYMGRDDEGNIIVPSNTDSVEPGKPEVKDAWVEWTDDSDSNYDGSWATSIYGYIHAAWEDNAPGGAIDKWNVYVTGTHVGDTYPDSITYADALNDPSLKKGGKSQMLYGGAVTADSSSNDGDYGRNAKVKVGAVNGKGETISNEKSFEILSLPRFRAYAENNGAKLEWTDLFNDTSTTVNSWEIWRKTECGKWTMIADLQTDQPQKAGSIDGVEYYWYRDTDLTNGFKYEYKVIAKCTDGKDRPSVTRTVTPSSRSASEVPGKPLNLTGQVVNGEIKLTWDAPSTGGSPSKYYIQQYYSTWYGDDWGNIGYVDAPCTNYFWTEGPDSAGTYKFRVYAVTNIGEKERPTDEDDFKYSDDVSVTVTSHDIDAQYKDSPGEFSISAHSTEGKITLNWTASEGAASYTLERRIINLDDGYEAYDETFGSIAVPASQTSFEDTNVEGGFRYRYYIVASNRHGERHADVYARAIGASRDQAIVDMASALIEGLPEPEDVTIEDKDDINEVAEAYDSLTDKQKSLVPQEKKDKLTGCLDALEAIKINEQYRDRIDQVIDLIDALPDNVTLADEDQVNAARNAYNALPEGARKLVSNYSELTAAESTIIRLKKDAANRQLVDGLLDDLRDLESMDQVTVENAETVLAKAGDLRTAVSSLDADQREMFDAAEDSEDLLLKLANTYNMARAKLEMDHDHILNLVEGHEATCIAAGNIAHYRCSACGRLFADNEGVTEITSEAAMIPQDANAHNWGDWTETQAPSCEDAGTEERYCALCNAREEQSKPATGHDWIADEFDPDNPETVKDENGEEAYKINYHCRVCGIPRIGYLYPGGEGSCAINDHTWVEDTERREPATCIKSGWLYYICSTCKVTEKREQDIDPTKHDWSDWASADGLEHKCTENITEERHCRREGCDASETRIVPAGEHSWDGGTVTQKADCAHAGTKTFTCTKCGDTKNEIIPADANAHDWDEWEMLDSPTCTAGGMRSHSCKNDPSHFETEAVAAAGHKWNGGVVTKQPAKGITGVRTYTCTVCGITRTEAIPALAPPAPSEIVDLPAVKITKPKAAKKKITVKWKKVSKKNLKKIGGIEIQVTGPDGYKKTFTVGKSKTSKKISKLKSKKKYSVRVRAYKWIGGVKHVSKWSKWKTVKVK